MLEEGEAGSYSQIENGRAKSQKNVGGEDHVPQYGSQDGSMLGVEEPKQVLSLHRIWVVCFKNFADFVSFHTKTPMCFSVF